MSRSRSRSQNRPVGNRSRSRSRTRAEILRRVLAVTPDAAGLLIGKGGETINSLCRKTGARIEISKEDNGSGQRSVTILGTPDEINQAVSSIEELMRSAPSRGPGGPGWSNGHEETTKVLNVPVSFVGMLIGKGGEKVKAMSRESGARIEVDRGDGGSDSSVRTVTLMGPQDAIDKACAMIDEVVGRAKDMFGEPTVGPGQDPGSDSDGVADPPDGFEECDRAGWLYHKGEDIFFEKATARLAWLNVVFNQLMPLQEGKNYTDMSFMGAAVTSLGTSSSSAAGSKPQAPKHVVIPDLHRVAQALKLPLGHIDYPAAMLAVFGSAPPNTPGVPVDVAARSMHEKLLRRMASVRMHWTEDGFLTALNGAMFDIASDHGGATPVAAVAIVAGRTVIALCSQGAHVCLLTGRNAESCEPAVNTAMGGATSCVRRLPLGSEVGIIGVVLTVGDSGIDDKALAAAALPQLFPGRVRAAGAAVLKAAREAGAKGPLAAACARLGAPMPVPDTTLATQPEAPGKKAKAAAGATDEVVHKVRVRQILIRAWKGTGPQPVNQINRKPVSRTTEEAELQMVGVLQKLVSEKGGNFGALCKANSECPSAMKGGADTGDLGWLSPLKDVESKFAKGQLAQPVSAVGAIIPTAVVKAAFLLGQGELSDLVHSELGVHLLQRTA